MPATGNDSAPMRIDATEHRDTLRGLQTASPRQALWLACGFATIKLLFHIASNIWQAHLGWGYFRDELYYILCSRHLDWGFVDQGPIVALQARATIALFGTSLAGIRMLTALAGATKVLLTGLLTWSLGGRRSAQVLAMLGVSLAPEFLALDSFLSMNSFEPVFWMTAVLAALMLLRGASQRWWVVFGFAAGLGLENKPSMSFFLIALLAGLLLTPQRRILMSRGAALGIALLLVLALPNLVWQAQHHWATLEFLHNGKAEHKNVTLSPFAFMGAQLKMLNPISMLLWGAGLVWLLISRHAGPWRFLGFTYVVFVLLMMSTGDAKDYYLAPIYPILFAAGGVAWEALLSSRRTRWLVLTYGVLLVITGLLILPMVVPVLRPQTWLTYTKQMQLRDKAGNTENETTSEFPQFFADRFGWQEMTDDITRIYNKLPAADRTRAGILCSNYGEASAVNFLGEGRGLPFAISGHNNYYWWGPYGERGDVMIIVNGDTVEELRRYFASVEIAGRMDHPYAMPYEHRNIYLCRGIRHSIPSMWERIKHYI